MRAAVYHGTRDVRIEDLPTPTPGPARCCCRCCAAGMCGTDATRVEERAQDVPGRPPAPGDRAQRADGPRARVRRRGRRAGRGRPVRRSATLVASAAPGCPAVRASAAGRAAPTCAERYYTLGLNTAGGMAELVAVPETTLRAGARRRCRWTAPGWPSRWRWACTPPGDPGRADGDRVVLIGAGAIGTFVLAGLPVAGRRRHHRRSTSPGRGWSARSGSAPPARSRRARTSSRGSPRPWWQPGADVVDRGQRRTGPAGRRHRRWCDRAAPILQVGLPGRTARRWTCTRW